MSDRAHHALPGWRITLDTHLVATIWEPDLLGLAARIHTALDLPDGQQIRIILNQETFTPKAVWVCHPDGRPRKRLGLAVLPPKRDAVAA